MKIQMWNTSLAEINDKVLQQSNEAKNFFTFMNHSILVGEIPNDGSFAWAWLEHRKVITRKKVLGYNE